MGVTSPRNEIIYKKQTNRKCREMKEEREEGESYLSEKWIGDGD